MTRINRTWFTAAAVVAGFVGFWTALGWAFDMGWLPRWTGPWIMLALGFLILVQIIVSDQRHQAKRGRWLGR